MSVNCITKRSVVALLLVLMLTGCGAARKQPQLNLLAMGDWGRNSDNQRAVAAALTEHVRSLDRKFAGMLTAGDNFYVQLSGIDDPLWKSMFEDLYPADVMDFPFYVAIGNHDYEENSQGQAKWQVQRDYADANPQSRWKFSSRWYRLELPEHNPLVTVLMLDSDQPLLGEAAWKEELEWLKEELAKPRTTPWLVCVAHHPFFSNGSHGDNGALRRAWGPLMQEARVDLYICGHDHDLQHLEMQDWHPSFLLVGGGGATTRPMTTDSRGPFSRAAYGFADLSFTPALLTARFIGVDGSPLHTFTRTPDGVVKVVQSTPSDPGRPRTVKSITRGAETQPATSRTTSPTTAPATAPARAPTRAPAAATSAP